MDNSKSVSTPLAGHFKLSSKKCSTSEKDKEEMQKIPYASAVCKLMYAMVCTRSNIVHVVGIVSRFLSNSGKKHWKVMMGILRYLIDISRVCLCFGSGESLLNG
uniref:Retrovirus-related Pol polyprotein from transposon TNT 1-94 n=1 Tax=Cajanus cajan TaxID=3821 RepID=A0A151TX70_CAJCA|nr:Retrovirus-related Pol polyprotein from transposon TNT 1-94 [Cajanus cajan]